MSRPKTIGELAAIATTSSYDPSRSLKDSLRAADTLRTQGKQALQRNDLEVAFVNTARAVTIVVEKIPKHPEYLKLTSQQKQNLAYNGNQLLETLETLKLRLTERYDEWITNGGEEAALRAEEAALEAKAEQREKAERERERREYEEEQERESERRRERAWQAEEDRRRNREEDLYRRRDAEERERAYRRKQQDYDQRYKTEIDPNELANQMVRVAKQRQADEYQRQAKKRDADLRTNRRMKEDEVFAHVRSAAGLDPRRSPSSSPVLLPPQPAARWASPERDREPERQRVPSGPRPPPGRSDPINYPPTGAPQSVSYITPKRKDMDFAEPLPLESPNHHQLRDPDSDGYESSASRNGVRRPSYPAPITTTSPGRRDGRIEYPRLMTIHQRQQGYIPSSNPIVATSTYPYMYAHASTESSSYYDQHGLPRPSRYATASSPTSPIYADGPGSYNAGPYPYPSLPNASSAPPYAASYPTLQRAPSIQGIKYASPPRSSPLAHTIPHHSAPSIPPKVPITPPQGYGVNRNGSFSAGTPPEPSVLRQSPRAPGGLRYVWLPQICLEKFLSIAAVNTARKVETCGLLLGKLKSSEYTVHTLLVPRQNSDENSCSMTDEEMIVDFSEKRGLVTLGWIHTHPTQSCFMSSLDLHTHAGYQTCLPEAFAIVCAPTSDPKFGVFALTNPTGMQIITTCDNPAAFHPHPNKAIYTDADHAEGHVRMADLPLEIADLRSKL